MTSTAPRTEAERDQVNSELEILILAAVDGQSVEIAEKAGTHAGQVASLVIADAVEQCSHKIGALIQQRAQDQGIPADRLLPLWEAFWTSFATATNAVTAAPRGHA